MKSEELNKFAQQLKTAREESSISLEQISAKSRIDIKFLNAIEEGNFDVLPEVYIKAFIKQYAVQIGLDQEEIVRDYESAKSGRLKYTREVNVEEKDEIPAPASSENKAPDDEVKNAEIKKPSKKEFGGEEKVETHSLSESKSFSLNAKVIVTIVAAVAVIAVVYFFFINGGGSEIVKETPFDEIMNEREEQPNEEKGDRFEMAGEQQSGQSQNYTASSDSLNLRLTASDTCWISAGIDNGNSKDEFLLYPQQSIAVKAKRNFEVILGNSGGVQLYLNGKKLVIGDAPSGRKVLRINENGIVNNSN